LALTGQLGGIVGVFVFGAFGLRNWQTWRLFYTYFIVNIVVLGALKIFYI
jgi:hypothetical protein